MNKIIIVLFAVIYSCKTGYNKDKYLKEIVSEKPVSISMSETYSYDGVEKNLMLNIPLEFKLDINYKEVSRVWFYYSKDNKNLPIPTYGIYSGDDNRLIQAIKNFKYPNYPNSVYILDRNIFISKEDAVEMLEKYDIQQDIEKIRTRDDTIKLISYRKWREGYPNFIKQMREIPDTIIMGIYFRNGKTKLIKKRINW